jgi:hypothetical protein
VAGRVLLHDIDAHADRHGHARGMPGPLCANPTSKLDSAIDLSDSLDRLDGRDRQLLELRGAGCTERPLGRTRAARHSLD